MAGHVHGGPVTGRHLGTSILLTGLFVVGEAAAGFWSNSLALISDAGHNLADALALLFSWYAVRAARRPADAKRTFGYHRAGILAALGNAVSLVLMALYIFWEAAHRLQAPPPVNGGLMIGVATVAVLLNGLISVWLHAEAKQDLNVRSAYLHMLGDAVSALGVVAVGGVIAATGYDVADPLVSLLIGGLILWSSWGILTEAVGVLMEAAPKGLDVEQMAQAVQRMPGVLAVHDLHAWTVASGMAACCFHIRVAEQSALEGQRIQQAVAHMLEHDFRIAHSTIQVEVEGCGVDDLHCTLKAAEPHSHSRHDHPH
jgi:cobalt-zinc-cadmium efflux system protein